MALRFCIGRKIDAAERRLGVSMEYLRHILHVSVPDMLRIGKLTKLVAHRQSLPPAPFHVARLVAVMAEDCGECVQIEVNLAKENLVAPDILRKVIEMQPSGLPEELADVYLFAECVIQNAGDIEPLRTKMRSRYGERGLVELSMAIALARTFPVIKRGLGYSTTCDRKGISV